MALSLCFDVGDYPVFVTCDYSVYVTCGYLVFVTTSQVGGLHFVWHGEIIESMGEAAAHGAKRPHAKGVLCDASFLVAFGGKR